jgi:hypothetical protein
MNYSSILNIQNQRFFLLLAGAHAQMIRNLLGPFPPQQTRQKTMKTICYIPLFFEAERDDIIQTNSQTKQVSPYKWFVHSRKVQISMFFYSLIEQCPNNCPFLIY